MRRWTTLFATVVAGMTICTTSVHALVFEKAEFSRSREGAAGHSRFVQYTNTTDETRASLIFRSLSEAYFSKEIRRLVREIKAANPSVKMQMFERTSGADVVIT